MNRSFSNWMLPGGPVLAVVIAWISWQNGLSGSAAGCAAVAIVCATWWIFECLSIAVVGLVPFVALPILGVVDHKNVAASYGHTMILLLLGGFLLSAAMERSGAHQRIAIMMVRLVGGHGGRRIVLGFMLATASLSMWISNSATTLMMLPIALAVLQQAGDPRLRTPLLLGIAYAASVGGMATPIGTPPNIVFMGQLYERTGSELPFATWMSIGLPITMILLPIIWWWVTRKIGPTERIKMPEMGPIANNEVRVLAVFAVTAVLWVFRSGPFGGWSAWMPGGNDMIGDATVALAAALFMFICPSGRESDEFGQTDRLLDWQTAANVPWGILIMFGGGMALATGFQDSGLSQAIGGQLTFLAGSPTWVIVLSICFLVSFLTEITSSTATAMLLLPILAEMADQLGLPPAMLMIPGTISCSCAFMLPVATAPNVIIFGAGGIRTDEMARTGLVLNFIAAFVITGMCLWLVP
ncbi:SLC13 family permease [Neorhodopirellula pilleata]|nr:SLC13 family permease [Neorhodopirellula pilleata]